MVIEFIGSGTRVVPGTVYRLGNHQSCVRCMDGKIYAGDRVRIDFPVYQLVSSNVVKDREKPRCTGLMHGDLSGCRLNGRTKCCALINKHPISIHIDITPIRKHLEECIIPESQVCFDVWPVSAEPVVEQNTARV